MEVLVAILSVAVFISISALTISWVRNIKSFQDLLSRNLCHVTRELYDDRGRIFNNEKEIIALREDLRRFYSLIENYSQLTCISGEEFDEKLEEVRKILEDLQKRGNNNGQEEKIA